MAKNSKDWHKKIAQARGEKWLKNLREGRNEAVLNPSAISLIRRRHKMLQSDMAQKLGLSEGTYQSIERGKRLVTPDLAEQIASVLSVKKQKIFKTAKPDRFVAVILKNQL